MKTDSLLASIYSYSDIPKSITFAITSLFGVQTLQDLSKTQLEHLRKTYDEMYHQVAETDYSESYKEYTLRYFPVNFFKIWTPLTDLLEKGQIKEQCAILELGCGPGSSTFGLLEFYRILAVSNPGTDFHLDLSLVEKEQTFLDIFKCIYNHYATDLPTNLRVTCTQYQETIQSFFARSHNDKYHLIIESNLFNPNEKVVSTDLFHRCSVLADMLRPNSSIIMIEPARDDLKDYLYQLKTILLDKGLSVFSPCRCAKPVCKAFASARVDMRGISIISFLQQHRLSSSKRFHYFEYLILRNDSLVKFELKNNGNILKDISSCVGKLIKFEAYILSSFDKHDYLDLRICDGSCDDRKMIVRVPKRILLDDCVCALSVGRGGCVRVRNGRVISETEIECVPSTNIRIL